jgi:hypothetical protein
MCRAQMVIEVLCRSEIRIRLDHVIVINERYLRCLLRSYLAYYNATRPHQSLHNQSPHPRKVQTPAGGRIVAIPRVDGLHHRYQRAA